MSTPLPTPIPAPAPTPTPASTTTSTSSGTYSDPHDAAVTERINKYIERANSKLPKDTVAAKLEWAWHENINQRELNAAESVDPVGRDADCYFAARHVIAADKSQAGKYLDKGIGAVAMEVYTGLKYVDRGAQRLGAPPFMRSNKKLPNAPPGGRAWEHRGAADGMVDNGQDVKPVLGHFPKP
jgi:hypothetical protein